MCDYAHCKLYYYNLVGYKRGELTASEVEVLKSKLIIKNGTVYTFGELMCDHQFTDEYVCVNASRASKPTIDKLLATINKLMVGTSAKAKIHVQVDVEHDVVCVDFLKNEQAYTCAILK